MTLAIGCALIVISSAVGIGGNLVSIDPRSGFCGGVAALMLAAGLGCVGWGAWG